MILLYHLLFLLHLTSHLALGAGASDAMRGLCNELSKIGSCKTSFRVPSAKLRMGRIPWFKPNRCKSKLKFPFGGWTCLPGTDKVFIEGPVGIDIGTTAVSTCDLMKKTIPGLPDLIQKSGAICKCMPDMVALLDVQGAKELVSSKSVGGASATLLSKFADLSQCAINAGLNVQDNKAGLSAGTGALVANDYVRVFTAAEVDLSRYLAFAGALSPCFTPAGCQTEAIKGFFEKYLGDSERLMLSQVKATIKPWSDGLSVVESSFGGLSSSTKAIGDKINQMQSQAASIINDLCPNAQVCANNTLQDFKKQVETTLDLSKQVVQVQSILGSAVADAKAIVTLIKATETAFDTVGDLGVDAILQKVISGQFRSMEELAGAMKAAQRLPSVLDDLQNKIPQLQKVVSGLGDRAPKFIDSLSTLLQRNWLGDFKGDQATARRLDEGVGRVQQMFVDIVPQATEFWASVTYLTDSIGSVASTGRIGQVDVRVASYQRWTKGWFDMPCLTTGKITFNLGIFKSTVPYPKFYRCKQNYNVPFPNHHIPYIKITLPKDSSLAKFGQGVKRQTTSISWARASASGSPSSSSAAASSSGPGSSAAASAPASGTPSSIPASQAPSSQIISSAGPTSDAAVSVPSSAAGVPSTSNPGAGAGGTAAPIGTLRPRLIAIPFGLAPRQDASPEPDEIPADPEVSAPVPSALDGYVTDSSVAAAAATATPIPTTAVFSETVVGGVTSTVQLSVQPTGSPTTEVQPDPSDFAVPASALPSQLRAYDDLREETLETVYSTWSDYGTYSFNMADPTMDPTDAGVQPSASASASASARPASGAGRQVGVGMGMGMGMSAGTSAVLVLVAGVVFGALVL